MPRPKPLSLQQQKFVDAYIANGGNGQDAARSAGYAKGGGAKQYAVVLLKHPAIRAQLRKHWQLAEARTDVTAVRVLEELGRIAFADLRVFYDVEGNLIPVHLWTDAMGAQAAGLKHVVRNLVAGDGHVDNVIEFKLHDKKAALELLAKHFKLTDDLGDQNALLSRMSEILMRGREAYKTVNAAARRRALAEEHAIDV